MKIAGIDLSLTSPGLTVCDGEKFSIENLRFYFLTSKKSFHRQFPFNIEPTLMKKWENNEERYGMISDWVLAHASFSEVIAIEGYAFGTRGRALFNIAENGGILKYRLRNLGISLLLPSPAEIKKFATGNGTAKKVAMIEQFREETRIDLMEVFKGAMNPASDIADSYFIAKYASEK